MTDLSTPPLELAWRFREAIDRGDLADLADLVTDESRPAFVRDFDLIVERAAHRDLAAGYDVPGSPVSFVLLLPAGKYPAGQITENVEIDEGDAVVVSLIRRPHLAGERPELAGWRVQGISATVGAP